MRLQSFYIIKVLLLMLLLFYIAGCGFCSKSLVDNYNEFGIKSAKMGLWNEAISRWRKITEIDPNNAKAHNNLGVAYESKGEFDLALAEYKAAIELDPENEIYKRNYARFKKNYEKATEEDMSRKQQEIGIED